jgi:TolB-like protein
MTGPDRVRATAAIEALSPRRLELLRLLAKGLTNDEIASALSISSGTVRVHVTAVLTQLEVKNRTEAAAAYLASEASPTRLERVILRPAIAVLPLLAGDDEPRAHVLAAGLTEDLASLFARWCWFPVIATHSSRSARSLGHTTREIGAALGARFIVDGGVRKVGRRVRVSLRVDDAEDDITLWANQHDVPWHALAAAQDALCQQVVAAAYPVLVSHARAARVTEGTELAPWELAHQGMALRSRREPAANAAALRLFGEALTQDSGLVLAHFGIGLASHDAVLNQWGAKEPALAKLHGAAIRCLEYAPHAADGYFLRGRYLQARGDWEQAIVPLEDAIGRNPSFAYAHACLSQSLQTTGYAEESVVRMRHAARLGPRSFQAGLATLHFMQSEYADALASAEDALSTTPSYTFARALAAASAYWLGDVARARSHVHTLREMSPHFQPSTFASTFGEQQDAVSRLAEALTATMRAS